MIRHKIICLSVMNAIVTETFMRPSQFQEHNNIQTPPTSNMAKQDSGKKKAAEPRPPLHHLPRKMTQQGSFPHQENCDEKYQEGKGCPQEKEVQ